MSSASGADDEAPTTSASKQTNFSQIFIPKLKVEYKSWERFLSKMVRLNVIQHKTTNIFYLMNDNCHSNTSYTNPQTRVLSTGSSIDIEKREQNFLFSVTFV